VIKVDARRLLCPMPVIRLQDAIKTVQIGEQVEIVCTDPGSINDISAWCRINKHELNSSKQIDNEYWFVVTVQGD